MHAAIMWRLVLGVVAGLAGAHSARAQDFAAMLKEQWTESGDCTRAFTLDLSGDTLRLTDHAGRTETEHVFARRVTGFATQVMRSIHGARIGSRAVYELPAPGQLSVTDAAGHADTVLRCPDPLPAGGTPQQFVEAIYARYASPSQRGGPYGSEASLREFFVPELAQLTKAAVLDQEFRVAAADCKTDQEPFIPTEHDVADQRHGLPVRAVVPRQHRGVRPAAAQARGAAGWNPGQVPRHTPGTIQAETEHGPPSRGVP